MLAFLWGGDGDGNRPCLPHEISIPSLLSPLMEWFPLLSLSLSPDYPHLMTWHCTKPDLRKPDRQSTIATEWQCPPICYVSLCFKHRRHFMYIKCPKDVILMGNVIKFGWQTFRVAYLLGQAVTGTSSTSFAFISGKTEAFFKKNLVILQEYKSTVESCLPVFERLQQSIVSATANISLPPLRNGLSVVFVSVSVVVADSSV